LNSLPGKILLKRTSSDFIAGYCIIKEDLSSLMEHVSLLHPKEYAFYNTLKFDKRRESYLLGRYAAKQAVSQLVKIDSMQSFLLYPG